MLGNDEISGCLAFANFVETFPDSTDGLDKSCTKHTRRADDDKHPKGDQGEMSEYGTSDNVEALDQLRQMMAPDFYVIFFRCCSAELLIMLLTVSCILRLFTVYPNCKKYCTA